MNTKDLLLVGGLAGLGYWLYRMTIGQRVSAVPGAQFAVLGSNQSGAALAALSPAEVRFQPIATNQKTFDPYVEQADPALADRITAIGTAAEVSLDVIANVWTGLTDLFGGSTGAARAPGPLQPAAVAQGFVPPADTVYT